MAASIFRSEKCMMTDDPLQFLLNLLGYEYKKYHVYVKIVCLVIVLIVEGFNVVCFADIFIHEDWDMLKRYLPVIILQQPGAMGLTLGITNVDEFFTFREIVYRYCWSINSAGANIQVKIQKDCKSITQLCFLVFLSNLLVYATFLPLIGDEGDIIYVVMFARKYFGAWANFSCCIYYLCFLCFAYGSIIVLFICGYIVFHLRFQFYLINEHMKTLSDDFNLDVEVYYNDRYQNDVYKRMVLCIEQHVNIKQVANMFSHITKLPVAGVTIISSSVFVATVFFIASRVRETRFIALNHLKTDCKSSYFGCANALQLSCSGISPHSNFRMCLSSMSCLTILITICSFGEMLSAESDRLHRICLESPWPLWTQRNQHCLLMLMIGCSKPLKISFYNLLDLNYSFLLKIVSITYKLQALFLKYK